MLKQLLPADLPWFTDWLAERDPAWAKSHLIPSYYLAGAERFGVMGWFEQDQLQSAAFFTRLETTFMHHYMGKVQPSAELDQFLGPNAQIFLRPFHRFADMGSWERVVDVEPYMHLDHQAWVGVFERSVPKYKGAIWQRGIIVT